MSTYLLLSILKDTKHLVLNIITKNSFTLKPRNSLIKIVKYLDDFRMNEFNEGYTREKFAPVEEMFGRDFHLFKNCILLQ